MEDRSGSNIERLFSFSVRTALISSRGNEEICTIQSSVAKNNFNISSSNWISLSGCLIAQAQMLLNGRVMRYVTVL